jgi:Bacterial Ig domain
VHRSLVSLLTASSLLLFGACGGEDLTLPEEPGVPATITVVKGNGQQGPAWAPLRDSVVVKVLDKDGNPVPDQHVVFVLADQVPGAEVTPDASVTGTDGTAAARWVLGGVGGTQELVAKVVTDAAVATSLEVRLTASAEVPPAGADRLTIVQQPSGSVTAGVVFPQQPVIQIQDASGNTVPRAGVSVTAAVASGEGTLLGTTTRLTDINGQAHFDNLLVNGAAGAHVLIFASPGYASIASGTIVVADDSGGGTIGGGGNGGGGTGGGGTGGGGTGGGGTGGGGTGGGGTGGGGTGGGGTGGGGTGGGGTGGGGTGGGGTGGGGTGGGTGGGGTGGGGTGGGGTGGGGTGGGGTGGGGTGGGGTGAGNQPPNAANDEYNAIEGFDHTLTVSASNGVLRNDLDPEQGQLTASDATDPPNGTVVLNSDGSFSYTPAENFYGDDQFLYRATDPAGNWSTASVRIHVAPVNDPPWFNISQDAITVDAGAGPQTVSGFAIGIHSGAPNEPDQTVEFSVVSNSRPDLFAAGPTLSRDGPNSDTGTLTFTPAAGVSGTAVITMVAEDNGGTSNGGKNTSEERTFEITVR